MLKQRLLTAAILIPSVLLILFSSPAWLFVGLTGFATLLGAWEWSSLMELKTTSRRFFYLLIVACTFFTPFLLPAPIIFMAAFIFWLLIIPLVLFYPRLNGWGKGVIWRGLMGIFVLLPAWTAVNYIRYQVEGAYALLFLFVLIWGADSSAYFIGKKWGKHRLAKEVSPGKSIEGAVGALIFSVLVPVFILYICKTPLHIWPYTIALSAITVIFSIIGDLFESMVKRQAGVKDSGQLLPGHGGLLDRIDSLTAAAPIFAMGATLLAIYL